MNSLWQFLRQLWEKCRFRRSRATVIDSFTIDTEDQSGSGPKRARRTFSADEEDALRGAFNRFFSPHQRVEEEIHFREVGADGISTVQTEEWRRDGIGVRGITTRTVIKTSSGELVKPESLKAVCWECRGYEAALFRCTCGRTLCHLHARRFVKPDGATEVLCAEHFIAAEGKFDTWAAHDAELRIKRGNAS